jgi:hypothetical protein
MKAETCWMAWQDKWGFLPTFGGHYRRQVIGYLIEQHGEPWSTLRKRIQVVKVRVTPIRRKAPQKKHPRRTQP